MNIVGQTGGSPDESVSIYGLLRKKRQTEGQAEKETRARHLMHIAADVACTAISN